MFDSIKKEMATLLVNSVKGINNAKIVEVENINREDSTYSSATSARFKMEDGRTFTIYMYEPVTEEEQGQCLQSTES